MTNSIPEAWFDGLQSMLQGPGNAELSMTYAHYAQGLSTENHAVSRLHDVADGADALDVSAVQTLVSRHRYDHNGCSKSFTAPKSLYRHQRTVHKTRVFQCFHCTEKTTFTRQDTVVRHMKTQHEERPVRVQCRCCEAFLRPRSLKAHIKNHYPTDLSTAWRQIALAERPIVVAGQSTPQTQLLPHLAEPREPIMLGVSLFVKFEPWGEDHRWLKNHINPDPNTYLPPEVRKLSFLLDQQSAGAQVRSHIDKNSPIPDVLAILCVFVCQTEGWDHAMRYCKALIEVAIQWIVAFGPEPAEFFEPSTIAVEVFTTILLRNLPPGTAATCKGFMVDMLGLLRRAAINTA